MAGPWLYDLTALLDSGPWRYDLDVNDGTSSVTASTAYASCVAASGIWEAVASGVTVTAYDDTRFGHTQHTFIYRLTDASGNVTYSNEVDAPALIYTGVVASATALSYAPGQSLTSVTATASAYCPSSIQVQDQGSYIPTYAYASTAGATALAYTFGWYGPTAVVAEATAIAYGATGPTVNASTAYATSVAFAPDVTVLTNSYAYSDVALATAEAFTALYANNTNFTTTAYATAEALVFAAPDNTWEQRDPDGTPVWTERTVSSTTWRRR